MLNESTGWGIGSVYNVGSTNTELNAKGCTEQTDITLSDLRVGSVIKVLGGDNAYGLDEWDEIGPFTSIDQLKALVDNDPNTVTETVREEDGKLVIGNKTAMTNVCYFEFDPTNNTMPGIWLKDDFMANSPAHIVMFIESQP